MVDFEERPRPKIYHAVGDDLTRLGVSELEERVEVLLAEIERTRAQLELKKASLSAADMLFGKR